MGSLYRTGSQIRASGASTEELKEINSYDKSIMEKVALMESLNDEEKHTIYIMLDAFIGNVNSKML